jgi:predicted HicB family RNase H-like nuclease
MLNHKGYVGHVQFDDQAEIFHGEIIGIRDVVTFQGKSVSELRKAFVDSVEDYLDFCKGKDREPEKPFSGKLLLRLDPDLHRQLACAAMEQGKSLNKFIADTLKKNF